jgi:hypothetical protein
MSSPNGPNSVKRWVIEPSDDPPPLPKTWIATGSRGPDPVITAEGSTPLAALMIGLARLRARIEEDDVRPSELRTVLRTVRQRRSLSLHAAAFLLGMEFSVYRRIESSSDDLDLLLDLARRLSSDELVQTILNRVVNDRIAKEASDD